MSVAKSIKRWFLMSLAVIIGATAIWFLGVDMSWFVEDCPDCYFSRAIIVYRTFGISVYEKERREYPTLIQNVTADLGKPCTHPKLARWHKHRWWGLCICAHPCINGTFLWDDAPWYNADITVKVKTIAKANPNLGKEFYERVVLSHDWVYWREFRAKIKQEKQPTAE